MPTTTQTADDAPEAMAEAGIERFLAGELAQQVQFLTARARGRGSGHANMMLADLGIKVRQYSVLSLAASGLKPSQRELGEFLALDPSQIVALVDSLEQIGAVQRETDPRDRRSKIIVATESGLELFERARTVLLESEDVTLGTLSQRERRQLRTLLMKIAF
ncbi:MarR family transcriptional regulator [Citricoccus sp. SGAir0253]|uniref:MarR family winged helix-turn-helix transcriptional regulator n=1 Tax=Citricoccus sp. SGAir0253 TaxID=2567881 RepID=UPI0010CCF17C|nr:MarR family winged helix-turn-helix transcriptional regulator [Citricoccus sp. SGAir0253]QCU77076.1 MarR family transcriptional regulator [Citricoccus sp. SGAir0253]